MYKWWGFECMSKHIVGTTIRLAQVLQISTHIETKQGGFSQIEIDISTHIKACQF